MSVHAETGFPDELMEKIVAYVEREGGRDAPLSPEDEAMVRDLLATNPSAQALADDLRSTNKALGDLLNVAADVDVPEHLVTMIRAHGALRTEREGGRLTGQVIPFRAEPKPAKRTWSYGPLAAAASIILVVAAGALLYQSSVFDRERQRLQAELASAETILADRADALQQLETEQAGLDNRLATLVDENLALEQRIEEASRQVATADANRNALLTDVADLNHQLSEKQQQVDSLTAELTSTDEEARAAAASLDQVRADHQALETRIAALGADNRELAERLNASERTLAAVEQQNQTLVAEAADAENALETLRAEHEAARSQLELEQLALEQTVGARERELAEVRTALEDAVDQIDELSAGRDVLVAEVEQDRDRLLAENERLREEGGWLNQVVGYHRLYAGTPREVEMQDKQALTNWLASMLGLSFSVPDLSAAGLTLVGGRVFAVNGMPTGQIAYHDREGRMTGFCFKRSSYDQENDPTLTHNDDLNLISWQKSGIDYVLVGWTDPVQLGLVATQLHRNYGNDI